MNEKFNVGQRVICTWGINKGKEFEIVLIIKDGYSCVLVDGHSMDEKYYRYTDTTLKLAS